jgi:hypothetical protein
MSQVIRLIVLLSGLCACGSAQSTEALPRPIDLSQTQIANTLALVMESRSLVFGGPTTLVICEGVYRPGTTEWDTRLRAAVTEIVIEPDCVKRGKVLSLIGRSTQTVFLERLVPSTDSIKVELIVSRYRTTWGEVSSLVRKPQFRWKGLAVTDITIP